MLQTNDKRRAAYSLQVQETSAESRKAIHPMIITFGYAETVQSSKLLKSVV